MAETTNTCRLARRSAAPAVGLGTGLAVGLALGWRHGRPFVTRSVEWSIGIYEGPSPLELRPPAGVRNPVLTRTDVDDVDAAYVADPFVYREHDRWYLFFEIRVASSGRGVIGLATSNDGRRWDYDGVVLDASHHLSYPCVLADQGEHFLIPDSHSSGDVRLYRASDFPHGWELDTILLSHAASVPTLFQQDDRWWMFVGRGTESLELLWAEQLRGPWNPHRASPVIIGDPRHSRPGGRVVRVGDDLIRFTQDGLPRPGSAVHAFRITALTPDEYEEEPVQDGPLLSGSGGGWNAIGMHHCDAQEVDRGLWRAAVDGQRMVTSLWPLQPRTRR